MKRALVVIWLLASPAMAQVGPTRNPYNPYANSINRGSVQLRPYISLDRLNSQYQSRALHSNPIAANRAISHSANLTARAASFRYYPNYPSNSMQMAAQVAGYAAARSLQPLPLSAPRPVETSCDPYTDDDGCLSDYAGWGP